MKCHKITQQAMKSTINRAYKQTKNALSEEDRSQQLRPQ